ncbi:MAG: DegV family EDD domain-containing protein [Lachnospiraceae bacterium]|nr:DegV family EDD domain-containing protein [Lachnospiraceae bacterium]
MKFFGKIKERIFGYLYDSSIYVKDRTFVLFIIAELEALFVQSLISMFLGESRSNSMITLAGVVIGAMLMLLLIKKDKIRTARIVVTLILVCALRPVLFFAKGGINNGTLIMFLLGSYYLVLVLDGVFRVVMCLLDTTVLIACGIMAYYHPVLLADYSRKGNYVHSFIQYIITLIVLTVLIIFQTRIYQKEAKNAEDKSKELEEMNRAQNRFFSSMSHEIRTPINTVLGLNEIILRQEDASEEIRRDAANIQGAGKMLLALINDILDMSKIEAGKMDIVPVNYDVTSLLSDIVNMIWLKAEEKGLKFEADIDPNVPEALYGDEVRIKQILINLLNNAVKYTQAGFVSLHIECEFTGTDDVLLKISVSDTGIGIKPEALPCLFNTFQRVDEEKNRYIEGTGLGLSIVKQLVGLMDGEITVNSVYTQGSTFTVTLKQKVSSDKRIGDINITSSGLPGTGKYEHSFEAPTARILIVDDDEMNLQVEKKLLGETHMHVDLALSGIEALGLTLRNRYDVILMDHLMPEMSGIECFERIRAQKGGLNQNIPVIVLTANAGGENFELYNNTGFDGYLVKPVSGRQLESMLLAHLPAGKVVSTGSIEMTGSQINTADRYAKKKPVVIATSTMSDLPQNIIKELQISIIPYTVITNEGEFFDNIDMDSEELVQYMSEKSRLVTSEPPSEEALARFFSAELKKAHHLIYITLTTSSSREYARAINAAKTFDNVTIVNSEYLSSSTGILVMAAARLAGQGMQVDRIVSELEETKKFIRCSFVVKNADVMARRERISPFMSNILNTFWLRPMLRVVNDRLGVGRFMFGSKMKCYEKYIKHALPSNEGIDTLFVFVTYAGMDEEDLLWIEEKVKERVSFENVVFQKASAGISSNCGAGTFGLLYMIKGNRNYNFGPLFAKETGEAVNREDLPEEEEADIEEGLEETSPGADEGTKEKKWYEDVPGIDPEEAIKVSGTEEAFLSVLQIYYDSYAAKSEEIQGYYDSQDWENYTIKVHALKSSSRLVGAMKIGEDAEALEMAGKRSDIDFITDHHDSLMEEYRAVIDQLKPVMAKAKEDAPDIPEDILSDAYEALLEFSGAMDYELVKTVLDSVQEYKLSPGDEERFERVNILLSQMDWDGIKETINNRGDSEV